MKFQRPPFHNRPAPVSRGVGGPAESHPDPDPEPLDDQAEDPSIREAEYLRHLTEEKTPVAVHLVTGESFQGFIEYYDRRFIRLTRQGAPNLFIFKKDIKYLSEG